MKKAFTLVELMIALTILIIMAAMLVGILNPTALINKAQDAQRKKDLNRIKISFEDYYNDKGCYPKKEIVERMMSKSNCESSIFKPWLNIWPCDPDRRPYEVQIGYEDDCPKWYKIFTSLENKSDIDILPNLQGNIWIGMTGVNYGISSGNISISEDTAIKDPYCIGLGNCYYYPSPNMCNKADYGCSGANCFLGECSDRCHTNCCGVGCN